MPQIFRVGGYVVYFWANEGQPLEPVHVHVVEGVPAPNATKIWITRTGKCLIANNDSKIPERALRDVCDVIEARSKDVINKWTTFYGEIGFYC